MASTYLKKRAEANLVFLYLYLVMAILLLAAYAREKLIYPNTSPQNMKISILATITLLAPLFLAPVVKADTTANFKLDKESIVSKSILLAQSDWQEYSYSTGQFAIQMPDKPTEEAEKNQEDGTTSYSYKVENPNHLYLVQFSNIPGATALNQKEIAQLLNDVPGVFVNAAKAKLVKTSNIKIAGSPGREFSFIIGEAGKVNGTGRVFIVDERMFILVGISPEQGDIQQFLNSFKLVN